MMIDIKDVRDAVEIIIRTKASEAKEKYRNSWLGLIESMPSFIISNMEKEGLTSVEITNLIDAVDEAYNLAAMDAASVYDNIGPGYGRR